MGRIEQYKKIKKPVYYRGHSITITDDGYYVDTSVCAYEGGITLDTYYTLYDKSLEGIKEKIDEFEWKWKESKVKKIHKI